MSTNKHIKVAFFDVGGTLVGDHKDWIPGARETLAGLRERKVRLGIISNTADLSRKAILDLLPADFHLGIFEAELVIFSSEVHVEKPAPEIFRLAVKRAGVKPGECLFCSEEEAHVKAAREKMKMQTVLLQKVPNSDIGKLIETLVGRGLLPA
jgi:HAD superfamily hydrolase (TIGR01509 family)